MHALQWFPKFYSFLSFKYLRDSIIFKDQNNLKDGNELADTNPSRDSHNFENLYLFRCEKLVFEVEIYLFSESIRTENLAVRERNALINFCMLTHAVD